MTRVRAVREWKEDITASRDFAGMEERPLHELCRGTPFAAFEWPTDAPPPFDKPEAALKEWVGGQMFGPFGPPPLRGRIVGTPWRSQASRKWIALLVSDDGGSGRELLSDLRPVEEPKPKTCEHGLVTSTGSTTMDYGEPRHFTKCCNCGTILSDRRKGERRKGERRGVGYMFGRRHPGGFDRRSQP